METKCSCCGKLHNIGGYVRTCELLPVIQEKDICFSCAYWLNIANNPRDDRQIIDGKCYQFEDWEEFNSDFVSELWFVFVIDSHKMFRSNHVRYIGKVPEHFRNVLPDSAKKIDYNTYRFILSKQGYRCMSKGCWDRYHCLWYSYDESGGPWNKIPTRHRIGDEKCPMFIHKKLVDPKWR